MITCDVSLKASWLENSDKSNVSQTFPGLYDLSPFYLTQPLPAGWPRTHHVIKSRVGMIKICYMDHKNLTLVAITTPRFGVTWGCLKPWVCLYKNGSIGKIFFFNGIVLFVDKCYNFLLDKENKLDDVFFRILFLASLRSISEYWVEYWYAEHIYISCITKASAPTRSLKYVPFRADRNL